MTKKLLSMILAIAMVVSMFAGLATTASAAEPMTLTFALDANPGGWPTANETTTNNYTYTLDGVDYTFALKNVKCNAGYLMLTSPAALGLPVISGYKLTTVVAKNSTTCSTSVKVGISSSDSEAIYISGGAAQTWSTKGSSYTYNLTEPASDTMYYLYATSKNAQIVSLELTYAPADAEVHVHTTYGTAISALTVPIRWSANVRPASRKLALTQSLFIPPATAKTTVLPLTPAMFAVIHGLLLTLSLVITTILTVSAPSAALKSLLIRIMNWLPAQSQKVTMLFTTKARQ